MPVHIETERLYLREFRPEDETGILEMDSDPLVHRYLGQKPIATIEEARAMVAFLLKQHEENGIARWAVFNKQNDEFLGWSGFKLMKEAANGHINHYDFGYRYKQAAWGKGIATEAARAALPYGLEVLKLRPVHAMTDVNNATSRHILEKLGFRFVEIFSYESETGWRGKDDLTATWYELP